MTGLAGFRSFAEVLTIRAAETPEETAYIFLEDGESAEARMTHAELERRARAIAATIHGSAEPGARVLLLYPPGLDYIAGVFGCFLAGAVAVPAYPPDAWRLERSLSRLRAIAVDSGASVALTTDSILGLVPALVGDDPVFGRLRWLATDALPGEREQAWRPCEVGPDTLAVLQYTSGSTGMPKGVMLRHGNLLHNAAMIRHGFDYGRAPVSVSWLPPYHDMGLIGCVLEPIYCGFVSIAMSPLAFLERPMRWLEAISKYRGTVCGGPNFAYALCVRKSTPEARARLDLKDWELAFCGAEPIHHPTLASFADAFAPAGFRQRAFYPCYGLAEATLIVSGGRRDEDMVARSFDRSALERGQVIAVAPGDPGARSLVGCGRTLLGQRIEIVDPDTSVACEPGQVGEVWVSGPSVSSGYWGRVEDTGYTFGARVRGAGPFLRTGDLGFVHEGELFIAGRSKDLIIVRGRNHYSEDLERTIEGSHGALRPGCIAAFAVAGANAGADGDRLVVVAEWAPERVVGSPPVAADEVVDAIRGDLWREHDVQAAVIALVRPGAVAKTSSGKLQRFSCRLAYIEGRLEAVIEHRSELVARIYGRQK